MDTVQPVNLESCFMIKDGDIPEWLLVEILIRLPVKLVFRYKLVSKKWLAIISHLSFARTYISRASSLPQPWTFISYNMHLHGPAPGFSNTLKNLDSSLEHESPSVLVLSLPLTQDPHATSYKVFGVSNGVVLYGPSRLLSYEYSWDDQVYSYSICNPVTGRWISLPPYSRLSPYWASTGFFANVGDDNVLASYKVVRVDASKGYYEGIVRFEVLAHKNGEWKDFNARFDGPLYDLTRDRAAIALNGILYWTTQGRSLLAYDTNCLSSDGVRVLPLPDDMNLVPCVEGSGCTPGICDAHKGRLWYFEVLDKHGAKPFGGFGIWVLNDFNSGDKWCLQHLVAFGDISCDNIFWEKFLFPKPISFHPFDSNVVYLEYQGSILSYNISMRKLEAHGDPSKDDVLHHKLFVIPPWPVSVTSPQFTAD